MAIRTHAKTFHIKHSRKHDTTCSVGNMVEIRLRMISKTTYQKHPYLNSDIENIADLSKNLQCFQKDRDTRADPEGPWQALVLNLALQCPQKMTL